MIENQAILLRDGTYASLSIIARAITGTAWNGPRFFGLRVGINRLQDIEREQAGSRTGIAEADRSRPRGGSGSRPRTNGQR